MLSLILVSLLAQASPCVGEAGPLMRDAAARAEAFDLAGAVERFERAAAAGCEDAAAAAVYLRGLQAARDAYGMGGSPQSLEPVRGAEAVLEQHAKRGQPWAEIARLVLMAAAAAAQSERGDMSVYLAQATQLEALQIGALGVRVPGVTAYEASGDLWLQVHWFGPARKAYMAAAELMGMTPRIAFGLARAAVRLDDPEAACASYKTLVGVWGTRQGTAPEIAEARAYTSSHTCGQPSTIGKP